MNEKIVSALVGLTGAISNNGKTVNTDTIVTEALVNCFADIDEEIIVSKILNDKYTISPNCKTCPTPCGNTSDYDMNKFHENKALIALKEELLHEVVALAKRIKVSNKSELPDEVYRALSFFGYALSDDSYIELIDTLKSMEV